MDDQRDLFSNTDLLEQGIQIRAVLDEPVFAGATVRQAAGIPHPDQVGRDQASLSLQMRQDVPPQIRRNRIAVQKDNRIAFAFIDISHFEAIYAHPFFRVPASLLSWFGPN